MTRIVIDPVELRRVAGKLTDAGADASALAGRIRAVGLPEMPAEVVPVVQSAIDSAGSALSGQVSTFGMRAKELQARALWAEISARLERGLDLTGAQMSQFLAMMRDGTLLDYATPHQADLAGDYVGEHYRDLYRQPGHLIDLARILQANGLDADFSSAFIEAFGAENMANVPRVIQAMEWGDALLQTGSNNDPMVDTDLAVEMMLDGYELEEDPVALLSAFSLVLANATTSGQLSRQIEQELAYDEDTWAVSQLLHEGRFGAEFLRDVFHNGVIAQIGREGGKENPWYQSPSFWPIGGHGDDPLSTDQKQIILDALERNPEAAALALSDRVPEEFQFGVLDGTDDPIAILYDHVNWDDDGEQLARLYTAGVDYANDHADFRSAYQMTESLVDRTLRSDFDIDRMTEALADDLADHHMENIHLSATVSMPGGAGYVEVNGESAYRLIFDKQDLTDVMRELSDHEGANETFLAGARDYQAQLILENTRDVGGDVDWAKQVGGFDGLLMNANDLENIEDFDADNARHRLVFSFTNSVVGAVQSLHPAGAAAGMVTGPVLTGLEDATGPSLEDLVLANGDAKELITNQMHAAIATGYHENRLLEGALAPPDRVLASNGHLLDLRDSEMSDDQIRQLLLWLEQDTGAVTQEAFEAADQARDNRDIDTG